MPRLGKWFVFPLLLASVAGASEMLEGDWKPGSGSYYREPGEFTVAGDKISFKDCSEVSFEVLRDEIKEDEFWRGPEKREPRRYQDIVLKIKGTTKCPMTDSTIFRFLIAGNNACISTFMLYSSDEALAENRHNAWGVYFYESCKQP